MSSDLRKAAQQALEALENCRIEYDYHGNPLDEENAALVRATDALRAALAEPEREPVAWQYVWPNGDCFTTTNEEAVRDYAISAYTKVLPHQLGEVCALYRQPHTKQAPVAWMMVNPSLPDFKMLNWEPRTDLHETWRAIPLYAETGRENE